MVRHFRGNKQFSFNGACSRYPNAYQQKLACQYLIWSHTYLSPKVDPTLKLSKLLGDYATYACFQHKSPNVHAAFGRFILRFCRRVLWVPVDPLTKGVCAFFVGDLGNIMAQIPPEKCTTKYLAKKKGEKKNTVTSRARRTRVVQIFIIFIPKTALTSDSWLFMGFGWTSLYAKVLHLPSDNVCSVSANNQKHATLLIFLHHALQNSCRHFCLFSSYRYFSYISGLACFVVFSHQVR